VKVAPRDIDARVRDIGPGISVVLIYGPDQGLVLERSQTIGKQIAPDLSDPFQVVRPEPKALDDQPSLLADEIGSMSMMGGRRLIRLDWPGADTRKLEAPLQLALEAVGDGVLVIAAGDLKGTAPARKLCEAAKNALAIPCYVDSDRDIADLISDSFRTAGRRIDRAAHDYLVAHLGGDRGITRSELDKLLLYKLHDDSPLTLGEAQTLIGDSAQLWLSDIAEAVTAGDLARLEDRLQRAGQAGESAVAILRTVQGRLLRMHLVRGEMDRGISADEAAKALRPPLFFKDRPGFMAALGRWSTGRLVQALDLLFTAEIECKTTGNPADVIMARTLLRLTKAAR